MGDKPSAAIVQTALRKTAEMASEDKTKDKQIIFNNSYMDDILGSSDTIEDAKKITEEVESILLNGGFKIKEWIISGDIITTEKTEDKQMFNYY